MKLTHLATASAAIALLGGAAYAQQTDTTPNPNNAPVTQEGAPPPTDTATPPATAATPPPVNSDAATPPATAATPSGDTNASAPAATQFAQQTASFSNLTVTNGPVPDTPENRSKFGGPDSRAGRMTKPAGN